MITEYQYYQVLTERDEALAKVESLTELVASLEEVRAKEYAFKQAKVEELTEELQCEKIYSLNCRLGNVDASEGELQRKVDELVEVITRLASLELMGITPEKTDWLEIYQKEFNARIDYARAALKQEGE